MLLPVHSRSAFSPTDAGRIFLTFLLVMVTFSNLLLPLLAQRWSQPLLGEPPIDLTIQGWGQDGLIVVCCLILFIGRALARGKRQAWLISVALFTFSLIDMLLERAHWISLVLTGSVLVLLLFLAPLFSIRSDTRSLTRGYGALVLGGLCISSYGLAVQFLAHGRILPWLLSRAEVLVTLRILCFLALWYGVMSVLRPVHPGMRLQQQERIRANVIIRRYGKLALVHFALNTDKRYFWSESGHALIAYRVVNSVALALGDPIGPMEEREALLIAFLAFCRQQDWRIVFYQSSTYTRTCAQRESLHSYKIGEEAIIDVDSFTLQGKKGADVRHAVARAKRGDITIECWHRQQLPENIFADMQRLSTAWQREQKIQGQFGFSMGRFPTDWSPELLTVVALEPQGTVQAFLTWTPMYAGAGWALDSMRRNKETVPGTMEFLIAESVAWAKLRGYTHMSLGLAPLAGLIQEPTATNPASFVERSAAYLHHRGILLGQYRSLYAFKAKFQPRWEERYLIVSERQALPQMLVALARVHGCGMRYMLGEAQNALFHSHVTRRSKQEAA